MMMSNRQHNNAVEEDEEQRMKRWKWNQEECCQAFRGELRQEVRRCFR